ncbi:hypothetical protein [Nocardia jinanensis]|uniref:Integral membrane protein n=1 Tax=Nocardia jinanensis TaxID=382504 RepID=A0A917VKJ8_9NOCA|nr:hypothetical protein [Nocardia jinanensis]GGK90784.1 hypothetical protein GCM10011588_01330 [Nocardia jinanensis]
MDTDRQALIHGPLFSRRTPLDPYNAASRISAYIYGNILVLTALIPVVTSNEHVGILVVLGTAASTFVAHSFAETVGGSVRQRRSATMNDRVRELRNSVPILSSAVLPCAILATGRLDWIEPRSAQILAELVVLIRIGGIVFVIGRLRGEHPGRASIITAVLLTLVATTVVVVKIALSH